MYLAEVADRAPDLALGQQVALKVVHPHLLQDEDFFQRYQREVEVGFRVQHQNVVQTLAADTVEADGAPLHFLVMEFVEGQTLGGLLQELGKVPEDLCRHIGREIVQALVAIHGGGIIHRDLKPENVLITPDHVVKVMDLGLARLQDAAVKLSQTGQFVGSVLYAAPEQFMGSSRDLDGRADLYSLGLTLYELSTGTHPFRDDDISVVLKKQLQDEAPRPGDLNPQLSACFEEMVLQLIQKDRETRFASADELLEAIEGGERSDWWARKSADIRESTQRPLRRIRIPRETALYGRDKELTKLRSLFERAKAGEGQALLLEGEAGVGKTRLVDEFATLLQQEGEELHYLFGSFPPGGAATAFGAFASAFREYLGTDGLTAKLESHYLKELPLLVPAFAALLRGESAPPGAQALTKQTLQTVLIHLVGCLAAERPVVLVVDDLHFAPEEGRGIFAALSVAVAAHPVILVGSTRRGMSKAWCAELERHGHVTRMGVSRLGDEDLRQLLEDALGSPRLAEDLAAKIALKSDGNPFFVFEILRGLREGQFLQQKPDGTWVSTTVVKEVEIPSTVGDLVGARVSDLEEEDRDILNVAACCGFEFDPVLVGEALGLRRIPMLKRLAHLEEKYRLVRSAGERYVFDHHQIQEHLYGQLAPPLAKEYHAALGETLEEILEVDDLEPDEIEGDKVAELAEHLFKGGKGKRGLRYLDAALSHYEQGFTNAGAVHLMDRALDAKRLLKGRPRIDLLQRKGRRLDFMGLRELERTALDEALALADESEDAGARAQVRRDLGWHLARTSDYAGARQRLTEAQEFAREAGDVFLESQAYANLGIVCQHEGRYDEARECWETQIELAKKAGFRLGEARAVGNLAVLWAIQGRIDKAHEYTNRRLELAKELDDRRGEAVAHTNLGNVFLNYGHHHEAADHSQQAIAVARKIGDRWTEAAACATFGLVLLDQGKHADAQEQLERSLALARECGYQSAVGEGLIALGRLEAERGRADSAARYFDQALELSRKVKVPQTLVVAAAHRALLPGGDADAATKALEENEAKVGRKERMEARFALWKGTRDQSHLEEAHRLLLELKEHVPEDRRDSMLTRVPLNQEIVAAWQEGPGA